MEFKTIDQIFSGWYLAVPDYQRDYEWTDVQNSTLAEDIFQMVFSSEDSHFTGAIVTVPFESSNATACSMNFSDYGIETKGNTKIKHVVDGQQRLTSLSVFLSALNDCAANDPQITSDEDKGKRDDFLEAVRSILFSPARNRARQRASHLVLNGNTGKCFYSGILKAKEKDYSAAYAGAKRLLNAHKRFMAEIEARKQEYFDLNKNATPIEYYWAIYDVLTKRMTLVEIQCDGATNAFQVFDSLNGKGMDLTAADRIKNIVMSWADTTVNKSQLWEQLEAYVGSDNLTAFFAASLFVEKSKRVSKSRLPDEFRETNCTQGKTNFSSFFSLLLAQGKVYGKLINRKTDCVELDNVLNGVKTISAQAFVLIFAAALHCSVDLAHPTQEFMQFVKEVLRLVVRFQVVGFATNKLDQFFGECISDLKRDADVKAVATKVHAYTTLKVSDELFERSFIQFAPDDSPTSEFYLRSLENYFRVKEHDNREKVSGSLTVEHIIPQTLTDEELKAWLGLDVIPQDIEGDRKGVLIERLANKALLYGDDNSSAGKKAYGEKVEVYKNGKDGQNQGTPYSTFVLIEQVVRDYPNKFSLDEIKARAESMAKAALAIW